MDLKTAAITGAVAGTVASFIFGKKSRGFNVEKVAKYAALGAGALAAGSYVMSEVGHRSHVAGQFTGHEHHDWQAPEHQHFRRW